MILIFKKFLLYLLLNCRKRYLYVFYVFSFNFIIGCTPDINWRILQNSDYNFEAIFPGRIHQQQRTINVQNQLFPVHVYFSKQDKSVYAVSAIKLAPSSHHSQSKIQNQVLTLLMAHFAHQTQCSLLLPDNKLNTRLTKKNNLLVEKSDSKANPLGLNNCEHLTIDKVNYSTRPENVQIKSDYFYHGSYQQHKNGQQTLWYVRFIMNENYIYQLTTMTTLKANYSEDTSLFFKNASLKFLHTFRSNVAAKQEFFVDKNSK